jgi:hypothetical protein
MEKEGPNWHASCLNVIELVGKTIRPIPLKDHNHRSILKITYPISINSFFFYLDVPFIKFLVSRFFKLKIVSFFESNLNRKYNKKQITTNKQQEML